MIDVWLAANWPVVVFAALTMPWALPVVKAWVRHEVLLYRRARRIRRVGEIRVSPRRTYGQIQVSRRRTW